jgi:hypothetical protein
LIVERDWTKYDEMHSVFRLNGISGKRLEELETYCMARFWTLNTLLDRAKVLQKRSGEKITLKDFLKDILEKVTFGRNAGCDLRKGEFENHLKLVLEGILDSENEEKERKIDMHNVIEMSRFLGVLGSQKIQGTLIHRDQLTVSYIIKTKCSSSGKVEYIKTISGKQNDATISVDIDLNDVVNSINDDLSFNPIWSFILLVKSARSLKGVWNVFRLCAAVGIDFAIVFLNEKAKNKM